MSTKKIVLLIVLFLSVLYIVVKPWYYRRGTALPFVEVIPDQKSFDMDSPKYHGIIPTIVVVSPKDRAEITQYVPTKSERTMLETIDLEGSILIGVFQGIKGDTIAGAKVTDVYQSGSDVYVHTFFTVPKGQLAGQIAGTSAYSIVAIDQAVLHPGPSDRPLTFHLIDQETQTKLAEVVFTP